LFFAQAGLDYDAPLESFPLPLIWQPQAITSWFFPCWDRVSQTFLPWLALNHSLPILASIVARIAGVSHWCWLMDAL
jgi:hypothetical protein